jgi:hypothetical protein
MNTATYTKPTGQVPFLADTKLVEARGYVFRRIIHASVSFHASDVLDACQDQLGELVVYGRPVVQLVDGLPAKEGDKKHAGQ